MGFITELSARATGPGRRAAMKALASSKPAFPAANDVTGNG
jgi:hypothetical protein